MMKPKGQTEHDTGMLEYLEDIIGTSRYKVLLNYSTLFVHIDGPTASGLSFYVSSWHSGCRDEEEKNPLQFFLRCPKGD
jgi:hypothetical protein